MKNKKVGSKHFTFITTQLDHLLAFSQITESAMMFLPFQRRTQAPSQPPSRKAFAFFTLPAKWAGPQLHTLERRRARLDLNPE